MNSIFVGKYLDSARQLLATGVLAVLVAGCATVPREVPALISYAWDRPQETTLAREYAPQLADHPGESGFYVLDDGREAFLARAALAASAERALDLQYYYVGEDATADVLLHSVVLAAKRGVRVRLLVDDLYAARRDFDLAALTSQPNIEVRLFNPFRTRGPPGVLRLFEFLGDPGRLKHRMHNKLWIADNAAAIVGGRNLGNEYFAAHPDGNFADLDFFIAGPVVRNLSRSFDEYWNSQWAVPAETLQREPLTKDSFARVDATLAAARQKFRDSDYGRAMDEEAAWDVVHPRGYKLIPALAEAFWDRPARIHAGDEPRSPSPVSTKIRSVIESTKREVILISPYYIPAGPVLTTMEDVARRGVSVRVLTNSLASTDSPAAYAGYARYRRQLLASGIELYEQRPEAVVRVPRASRPSLSGTALHAKAIIVDRAVAIVGSMNLDPLSHLQNTEVAIVVQSRAVGEELGDLFDDAILPAHAFRVALATPGLEDAPLVWLTEKDGKELRYESDPLASFQRRAASLLGVFVPEDLM